MHDENEPNQDEIAQRAYRRYEERGRAEGNDQADWFEAETQAREEARTRAQQPTGSEEHGGDEEAGRARSRR